MVEVIQSDRDAAADLYSPDAPYYTSFRTGEFDEHPDVQAFARHREAALTTSQAQALVSYDFGLGGTVEKVTVNGVKYDLAQAAAQEQRIVDALAWLRDHIREVDDDNSYWGGPHKRTYLDAPAILKELTARAVLSEPTT